MLGEELCKLPKPTILTTKRCQSSQANPEFVDLKGSRAVFCSELCEGEKIKSATLREITGNDRTRQRGLYGSQETIRPVFSLFLFCNSRPAMDAPDTDAIWDRERSVHFRTKFVDSLRLPHERLIDRELKTRLKSYAPHLMLKLLRFYTEYRENGYRLDPPQQVLDASKTYQMENNPVEKFFEEQVLPATTSHMPENNVEDPQHAAKFEKEETKLRLKPGDELQLNLSDIFRASQTEGLDMKVDNSTIRKDAAGLKGAASNGVTRVGNNIRGRYTGFGMIYVSGSNIGIRESDLDEKIQQKTGISEPSNGGGGSGGGNPFCDLSNGLSSIGSIAGGGTAGAVFGGISGGVSGGAIGGSTGWTSSGIASGIAAAGSPLETLKTMEEGGASP
ncbi:hypothetical protein HK104_000133 [Borealophlyctis nickersoniae]|nr:hypothetical protein HK104_000133 [Borealophlyctis nickersoniae]